MLRFGDLPAAIHWIDLPGIARYGMEFALYAPDRRACLSFPSPFLRNEPAVLEIEGGDPGGARSWRSQEVVSYSSGFQADDIGAPNSSASWVDTFVSSRAETIYAGTSQVQRNIVAERILGLPKARR